MSREWFAADLISHPFLDGLQENNRVSYTKSDIIPDIISGSASADSLPPISAAGTVVDVVDTVSGVALIVFSPSRSSLLVSTLSTVWRSPPLCHLANASVLGANGLALAAT